MVSKLKHKARRGQTRRYARNSNALAGGRARSRSNRRGLKAAVITVKGQPRRGRDYDRRERDILLLED